MFCPGRKFDLCNWATEMYFDVFSKYHMYHECLHWMHGTRHVGNSGNRLTPGSPPIDLESLPGDGHIKGNKPESMAGFGML